MSIRFDSAYNREIQRIVKNFNQKRNRAIQKGYSNLPPALTVSELKQRYDNRKQLNRELNLYKKFSASKDALKKVENSGGARAIKWEFDYLKKNLKYAKDFFDRQIEEARSLDTNLKVTQNEYINNLKSKRDFLDLEISELSQSQFRTFKKTINEYIFANERKLNSYRSWMNEVEKIMRILGYDEGIIDEFFESFNELSPQQFLNLYRSSDLIARIYELYLPTNDIDFKLSTSEEDAKSMINTLIEEKDEIINKAKTKNK